jgi:pSer/pThr/pTyr-binding forkhead associated (FHA) protein
VILSVFKNNQVVTEVDLAQEIMGAENSRISFFMGRADSCHVVLDDKMISREHAEIIYDNGSWSIVQNSEFSPLIINGAAVSNKILNSGDIININPFSLNVTINTKSENIIEESIEDDIEENINDEIIDDMDTNDEAMTQTVAISESEILDDDSLDSDEELLITDDDELEAEEDFLGDDDTLEDSSEEDQLDGGENSDFEFPEENDGTEAFEVGEYEGDGEEDDYGLSDDYDDDDKTQVLQSFAKIEIELFGEYAPYDKINVELGETYIGRDPEKCSIVLNDPEVSSVHAVLRRNNITCTLEDMQSGNGTLLNGERVNKQILTNEDEFIIGATTFTVNIGSDFLEKEKNTLMPVEENQSVDVEEIVEVGADFEGELQEMEGPSLGEATGPANNSLLSKDSLKDPAKRKKILIILVVLLGLYVMLDDSSTKDKEKLAKEAKAKAAKNKKKAKKKGKVKITYTKEQKEFLDGTYLLAKELSAQGKYDQAIFELDKLFAITPDFKNARQIYELAKVGLAKIEELERKKQAEIARKIRMRKVKDLVEKARVATTDHNVILAEGLFSKIMELDPENFDVPQLKLELDAWKKEQDRIAVEKAQKEAERKRQVNALAPGKRFYMKEKWHSAILKLEAFLRTKGLDEDLVTDANAMIRKSKDKLNNIIKPLLGKARSLREGQDLKGAYEHYKQILEFDPTSAEALNEMDEIRVKLDFRSKKIYQEAIISESLNLYNDAKEKFQEVQQVAPSDSDYYRKATQKLKEYLD